MISLQVSELARAVDGALHADDAEARRVVSGLTWDSRKVEAGNIFLAMPGERVDGNDFVVAAIQAGAGCILCTREPDTSTKAIAGEFICPYIVVSDGVEALTKLAAWWRRKLHAVVIGITGSTGKTSTKDFLRSVLSQRFKTTATVANHNNEIGVPATILSAEADTEVLIVELGMRGLGQIKQLCHLVMPSIGIITNIGMSHLELLGSQDNIALAKSELLTELPVTGLAVLNADDTYTPFLKEHGMLAEHGVKTLTYGFAADADVRADEPSYDLTACAQFDLTLPDQQTVKVKLPLAGRYNVSNALAAATVGSYLGLKPDEIAKGLAEAKGSGMRMEVEHARGGVTVVNDAYNASPDSMRSSIDTLCNMDCTGRHIAVLGDMGELGDDEYELHERVGRHAADSRLDLLVCVGTLSEGIARGALAAGMEESRVKHFATVEETQEYLAETLAEGDLVLVKASRFMELERIVKGVVE